MEKNAHDLQRVYLLCLNGLKTMQALNFSYSDETGIIPVGNVGVWDSVDTADIHAVI